MKRKIYVLDNTSFVSGIDLSLFNMTSPTPEFYITERVLSEAKKNDSSFRRIEIALMQNLLQIQNASTDSIDKVKKTARRTGDIGALSETDIGLIALCIDLKRENPDASVLLFSDDYSVQNVCSMLNPPVQIVRFGKEGIQESIEWEIYCPYCFRKFDPSKLGTKCPECGVILKRRRKKARKKGIKKN